MEQLVAHTVSQKVLDCGPGLGGLISIMGPTNRIDTVRVYSYYYKQALLSVTTSNF